MTRQLGPSQAGARNSGSRGVTQKYFPTICGECLSRPWTGESAYQMEKDPGLGDFSHFVHLYQSSRLKEPHQVLWDEGGSSLPPGNHALVSHSFYHLSNKHLSRVCCTYQADGKCYRHESGNQLPAVMMPMQFHPDKGERQKKNPGKHTKAQNVAHCSKGLRIVKGLSFRLRAW